MEPTKKPTLRERLFEKCQIMGRSPKTAETYWGCCEKFLRWQRARCGEWVHPDRMGAREIEEFLTHLARDRKVSPSTQNQNLQGILFLYHRVLKIEIQGVNAMRAKRPIYVPTVLSRDEIASLFKQLIGRDRLIAFLCYACDSSPAISSSSPRSSSHLGISHVPGRP